MRRLFMILALAAGCSQSSGATSNLVEAWKKSGLQPTEFATVDAKPVGAEACQSGKVSGIDATVCDYADPDAAKRAEAAGLTQVGEATGASIAQGKQLLVLADRAKTDTNGKTIKQIATAFRNR